MRTVETDPRPSALVRLPALTPLLESLTKQLTRCQNTLEEYIAEKRTVFPRFFFLSDDDLLELLGQARANSQGREGVLQSHIKKLFPGCIGVHLGPGDVSITALKSHHDERLVLDSPVDIDVPVEIWLKCLEKQMRDSLRTCIKQCLSTSASQNRDALTYPTQVLCLAQSIHFTEGTERAITAKGLHSMRESVRRELDNYIRADVQGDDENAERGKLQALVLQCNHHLAILDELISNGASSLDHWHWQKQLRFYHENKTEITAKMGLAKLPYTYEYLGTNTGTLVRTQLTDQCFLILTQALHLGQAGNPFGPAGTGKTESVKALGGLLGRLVLVFNCDEGMDKTTMGRLLSGLALSGSWGCFDEFNRLEEKTLSGIAQQFASLLGAISSDDSSIMATLNGKEVCVSTGCGVFVTMNPAGGGYGGRRRLPAALARNLRPAAMWSPRKEHIATALLAAHGYSPASTLADKIILCYNMASSLLSPMHHYDWGLRALKTVIGSCGAALRKTIRETKIFPLESQQMALVVESLKLNTLSKLSYEDSERFENLLKLIFPGVQIPKSASDELTEALKESYKANNLTFNENQMQKCIEVYEQLKQRMGVVIVGPPGTGKSTVQLLLRHALNKLGKNVSQYTICPKAMNRTDLLGYIDPDTRQWNDGVISTTALAVSNQLTDVWCWVICDGDVDPEWIESLNSVLDDNRLLTLPSGWRIQFGENVNFIFETHNLSYASPATITRMGIISLSEEECCFKEVIQSWSVENNVSEEWKTYAIPFLQQSMSKVQEWSSGNMSEFIIPCHTISLVRQILSFLNDYKANRSAEEQIAEALAKGLTCVIKQEAAESTLEQVSQWTGVSPHTLLWNDKSLSDSGWDTADETGPLLFSNRIQESLKVCQMWMDSGQHFMIVGPPASGKSLVLEHLLKEARDSTVINLQCTPVFNHQHIIQALKQKSALGSGGNKSGGRVILVVRSLQRAASDKWNTSLVQSFLLQLIQYGGFWENAESVGSEGGMRWLTLRSFLLIVTASTGDTSLKPCPRFTNSVRLGTLAQPDEKELSLICGLNLGQVLKPLAKTSKEVQKIHETSLAMFAFYNEICNTFVLENHYKWTPRDLTLWCSNLKLYKITDIADIINVVCEEASCIFKDRLISIDERRVFDSISFKHLGITSTQDRCYIPKMTDKGFYMEPISSNDFGIMINKIISHCNTEAEAGGAFGEAGAEDCDEMRRLCAMVGRTCGSGSGLAVAGSVGVGRRAAIKIAADILSATLYTMATPQQFTVQIKNILSGCGCDGVLTLLVLEEGAANDNNVLGCVEAILTGGLTSGGGAYHLPLSPRELEAFISQMKTTGGEPRTVESFVNNVRKHLGIIFLLDVKDANLKNLLETYRLLYQRCHFIWMNKWSDITLRQMPISIAKRLMIENEIGLNTIPVDHIFDIYSSITDDELSTPYRYVMMLKTYFNIYQERKQLLEDKRIRLTAGVSALTEAQSEVTRLKSDAAKQQTALAEKQTKANQALNQIGVTMQSATLHKEEMQTLKKSTEIENAKLQERKKAIELELSEVEPAIQEARAAVGDIGTESLSEVRSLRAPPVPVRDVLEAVLRLMGIADTSWHSMKVFLSRRGIKEDIRTFDASNITRESLAAVEKLLIQRESSFQEKTARRASVACAPLAAWVLANVRYAHVLYKITPLEQEQRHLAKNLADAEAQMENLSSGLNTVDERVAALKGQLNTFTKEATEIEIKLTAAQNTINKAEQLVLKLSDEFQRWQTNLQDLTTECEEISLRALLAAGFITYLANEDEGKRSGVIQQWCKIVGIGPQSFEIKHFLTTHDDEAQWTSDGLPSDSSAFHNAIIINEVLKESKCGLVPLIIDPNGGSIKWLLNHLAKTPKDVISQQSDKFNTSLQHAIRFGKVFIIEELTSIDDSWTSLLRGQIPCSVVGVNSINPAFRLVLCSRDTSLPMRLVPYHRALISIVDFTPQLQGLTDQLIYHAVKQEEPELQEELMQINSEKSRLQIQQTQLQVTLLSQLSSGDILQNAALLESLEKTQQASREIKEALQRAHQVSSAADLRCAHYSSGASRAASSAIAVAALTAQHPRAALSLQTVIQLFLKALTSSKDSTIAGSDVSQNVVRTILERVLTALHKEHHCSVTLYLLHLIYPEHIPLQEWEVLISIPESQIGGKSEINIANEVPAWINEQRHPYVQMIKLCLPEIYTRLHLDDTNIWKKFSLTGDWENIPVEIGLTSFQKVIVVWATKPDKLYSSLMKAASQILGVNQLLPGGDLLAVVERWGSPEQPILVIGTEDNDPIDQIKTKAAHLVGIDNYRQAWLSAEDQQYEESIKETVEWARKCGGWAVVSVGVGAWPAAERVLLTRNHDNSLKESHPRTRIWIVAEDGVSVPSLFATACINIVMEAPAGIRNNIIRTLSLWSPQSGNAQRSDGYGDGDPKRVRLEFSLGLVHSIIQERCSYIPQGWRRKYGFSWGDASAGRVAVCSASRATAGGLCATLYGGRVTCQRDSALTAALIAKHFDEEVAGHKWKPLGMDIALPMTRHLQDYMGVLSNFPITDSPAQLGLPNNIHRAKEQQAGTSVIVQLKSYSHGEASVLRDVKLLKKKLTPIFSLWKKINSGPTPLVKAKITDNKLKADGSGLTALLTQEWTAAVVAVKKVHTDLAALRNSTSLTDPIFKHIAEELIADQTPEIWIKYWPGGHRSASRFIVGLCHRAAEAQRNVSVNTAASQLPSLRFLLQPERIPFALRWEATLRLGVPPDRLVPVTTWGDGGGSNKVTIMADGILPDADPTIAKIVLRDLWLEGAIWEGGRLQPCRSDSPTPMQAPPISFKFVPAESINDRFKENIVEIPIYTSSDRIELVFNVGAPSADQFNTNLWLLNSTALIIP